MSTIYIKKGDTGLYVRAKLYKTNADGTGLEPENLAGSTVKFIMKQSGAQAKVSATLAGSEIVDEANGEVQYEWEVGDTDTEGDYLAEFEVTSAAGVITFWDLRTLAEIVDDKPAEPLIIRIVGDLG